MRTQIALRIGAILLFAFLALGSWFTSGALNIEPLRYVSAVVFVGTILFGVWDLWLWRLPWVQMIPSVPVSVRGTWKGTLESHWIGPDGVPVEGKVAFLVVRQTATLVHVSFLSDESASYSSLAGICKSDGLSVLHYLYLNRPGMKFEDRSRMHHGSTTLEISGKPARRLNGRYWTDRDSRGELDLQEHRKRLADDYNEARALFR
ncbi:hypothetical protein [Arthrobacter sp. 35W]|uniref:Cap15 family cyclic dinucleotide receptor domain-containing protein n=1 Tax=Arthrobacter sp. 35W TaxID=1132441 RepID=UPI0018CA605F